MKWLPIPPLGNPFRRRRRERWYLISTHRAGVGGIEVGPFSSKEKALDYPNTFGGFVDSPAFGPSYVLRAERRER